MAIDFKPSFASEGTYAPDLLVGGDHPIRTLGVTIASGQNLLRGALIGKVTATGKFILSLSAAVDGSQNPVGILGEDVNATAGDVVSFEYVAGDFNSNKVTFGTGHTLASVREVLHARSIYLHDAVPA
jgi:hypothetical protein